MILSLQKEMGIDDDYMKQIEEQKRKRAEILRQKAERWKSSKDDDSAATRPKQSRLEDPRSDSSRHVGSQDGSGSHPRKSIYINPAAFKGDLSVLNNNLKQINMSISSDSLSHSSAASLPRSSGSSSQQQGGASSVSSSTGSQARVRPTSNAPARTPITGPDESSPRERPKKPKTILRVTKNKKGEIIHMEKLLKVIWLIHTLQNVFQSLVFAWVLSHVARHHDHNIAIVC